MCFTCWLRSGFSHFINMDSLSFTWCLVAAESRISKQSGVQDALQNSELCRCLKTFEDLSESKCSRTRVEINNTWMGFHTDLQKLSVILRRNLFPENLINKCISKYIQTAVKGGKTQSYSGVEPRKHLSSSLKSLTLGTSQSRHRGFKVSLYYFQSQESF